MVVTVAEKDIQKAILQYLKMRGYVCKRNNAGKATITNKYGKSHWINIGEPGWPDIVGLTKDGKFFGIEVKTRRGIVSPLQAQVGQDIVKSNGVWFVARTVDDVISRGF